jgi:hypothetical protein
LLRSASLQGLAAAVGVPAARGPGAPEPEPTVECCICMDDLPLRPAGLDEGLLSFPHLCSILYRESLPRQQMVASNNSAPSSIQAAAGELLAGVVCGAGSPGRACAHPH